MYARFEAPADYTELDPDQIKEYSAAAEKFYSPDHEYHNFDTHIVPVVEGVRTIGGNLALQNVMIPLGALTVAASWHDALHHEDHTDKHYNSKEDLSAYMLDLYLEDKPVTEAQGTIMRDAILATDPGLVRPRYPYETILDRADKANMGGPTDIFLRNVGLLYREALVQNLRLTWEEFRASSVKFIRKTIEEHDEESRWHNLALDDTTVDVNDIPFRVGAEQNIEALLEMEDPLR